MNGPIPALQARLENLTRNAYALAVPEAFVERFFADRRVIRDATAAQLQASGRLLQGTEYALREGGNHLWGQSTIEENYALTQVLELLQPKTAVEIGLFRGQTALTIHRALGETTDCSYLGIDPDPVAIATAQAVLKKFGLGRNSRFSPEPSRQTQFSAIDFALIDGDHAYTSVAADFAAAFNALPAGGVIAMHDVGTPVYGCTQQDPGHLLHRVLPGILGADAKLYCLDSMCRQVTMQKLAGGAFTDTAAEAEAIARVTMADTASGWGGMGFIVKLSPNRQINLRDLLARTPAPTAPVAPPPRQETMLGRIARKIARHIP
jgi:predicted O-methyltransferase YrrM